jgi:hypothetical protein
VSHRTLPEFRVIEAALRSTTERLAREISQPSAVAPAWDDFEWDVARATAAMQGITVLLANRLRWQGPASWRNFLHSQHRLAVQRDGRIQSLLLRLDQALRAERACCIGLKGSAVRALALHDPGERPMGDVDLLAQGADCAAVRRALEAIDYRLEYEMRRHQIFAPRGAPARIEPGEHPDNPLKIEVHFRISEALPVRHVDITAGLRGANAGPGLAGYACRRELFRHLLLHAAGNMRAHALRQVQLQEISLLSQRLDAGDWDQLLDTPESGGGAWWMWPVLELAQRYHPGMPPQIARFRAHTPRWLRAATARATLTELSWSNLRIAAFPGIEWSRSATEALRFMGSRIRPGAAALHDLEAIRTVQPAMLQLPWYGIPHARRILRWLFSRPPRVQTLTSVLAARGSTPATR